VAGERRQRSGRFRSSRAAARRRRPTQKPVEAAETPAPDTPATGSQSPEAQSPPGVEPTAPTVKSEDVEGAVSTVEMADVYRSLVANLRDKLGGTINDANADAIAHAAAQVYRREVEPRLWEEKSAHELLDGLGVPRSGAFVPYSLGDRLLLLRRSGAEDPYRAQAHELLDELAVPRLDGAGHEYSLQARLTYLLGSFDGDAGSGGGPNLAEEAADGADEDAVPGGGDEALAGPDLVDALEAIQRAVGPGGEEDAVSSPPPPTPPPPAPASGPAPDLIGLGSLLGTIQEELVEVRQAVESLRQEVRDAVALFQAGAGSGVPPVAPGAALADGGPEIVVRRVGDGPEAAPYAAPAEPAGPDFVPPDSGSPNGEGREGGPPDAALGTPVPSEGAGPGGPEAEVGPDGTPDGAPDLPVATGPAGPLDPTRVLPAVAPALDGPETAEEPGPEEPAVPRRRSRRFVVLILLVLLVGALLAAGITAAIVLGWDELESRFLETVSAPALRSGTQPVWGGPGAAP
jgi:hypothetical protein